MVIGLCLLTAMLEPGCLGFHSLPDFSSPQCFDASRQLPGAEPDHSKNQPQLLNNMRTGSKRRKPIETKVISVPVGEPASGPPADSWAWRKYGQKPIKGSPYPRSYYRCSSSKGCPARKQVERSRTDPSMLMITYTSEHNHQPAVNGKKLPDASISHENTHCSNISQPHPHTDMNPILSSEILESPAMNLLGEETASAEGADSCISRAEIKEDEDDLFAGLGELPESSAIFFSTDFFNET